MADANDLVFTYKEFRDYVLSLGKGDAVDLFYEAMNYSDSHGGAWAVYLCPICGKKIDEASTFLRHIKRHRTHKLKVKVTDKPVCGLNIYERVLKEAVEDPLSSQCNIIRAIKSLMSKLEEEESLTTSIIGWIEIQLKGSLREALSITAQNVDDSILKEVVVFLETLVTTLAMGDSKKEEGLDLVNVFLQKLQNSVEHFEDGSSRFVRIRREKETIVVSGENVVSDSGIKAGDGASVSVSECVDEWVRRLEVNGSLIAESIGLYDTLTKHLNQFYKQKEFLCTQKLIRNSFEKTMLSDTVIADNEVHHLQRAVQRMSGRQQKLAKVLLSEVRGENYESTLANIEDLSERIAKELVTLDCELLRIHKALDRLDDTLSLLAGMDYRDILVPLVRSFVQTNADTLLGAQADSSLGKDVKNLRKPPSDLDPT